MGVKRTLNIPYCKAMNLGRHMKKIFLAFLQHFANIYTAVFNDVSKNTINLFYDIFLHNNAGNTSQ